MTATELRRFDLRVMRDVLAAETAQSSLDHARFSFFGGGGSKLRWLDPDRIEPDRRP